MWFSPRSSMQMRDCGLVNEDWLGPVCKWRRWKAQCCSQLGPPCKGSELAAEEHWLPSKWRIQMVWLLWEGGTKARNMISWMTYKFKSSRAGRAAGELRYGLLAPFGFPWHKRLYLGDFRSPRSLPGAGRWSFETQTTNRPRESFAVSRLQDSDRGKTQSRGQERSPTPGRDPAARRQNRDCSQVP